MHAMSSADASTAIFRRACRLFRMMHLVICSISQNRRIALKANELVAKEKRTGGRKNNVRAQSFADLERASWQDTWLEEGRCETAPFVRDEGESAWRVQVCVSARR